MRSSDRSFYAEGEAAGTPFLIDAHAGPDGNIDEARSTFWVGDGRVPIKEFMRRTGIVFEVPP